MRPTDPSILLYNIYVTSFNINSQHKSLKIFNIIIFLLISKFSGNTSNSCFNLASSFIYPNFSFNILIFVLSMIFNSYPTFAKYYSWSDVSVNKSFAGK